MSDQIKSTDIFAPDAFTKVIEDAKVLEATLLGVAGAMKTTLSESTKTIGKIKFTDSESINKYTAASKDALAVELQYAKVEKARIEVVAKRISLEEKQAKNAQKAIDNTQNLTKQVRDLTKELSNMNRDKDPAGYDKIAKQAGKLKDQINDAKEAVKVFSKESKASQAKTLFGQIASDVADLDFASAADKAKQFAAVMRSITFAEVIGGLKNFGKALLDVGTAMLTNPFVLIVAGIAAVVLALKETYDAYQMADKAIAEINEDLKKQDDIIQGLNKQIADLGIEYDVLTGKISKAQGEIQKIQGNAFDDFMSNSAAMREELKKNEDLRIAANKRTATEYALGDAGEVLHRLRVAENNKKFDQADADIRAKFEQTKQKIYKKGVDEIKIIRETENQEKKKGLEKQINDELSKKKQDEEKLAKLRLDFHLLEIEETQKAQQALYDKDLADTEQHYKELLDLINYYTEEEKKLIGVMDESGVAEKAERDKKKAEKKKQLQEESDMVIKAVEDATRRKEELTNFYLDKETDKRKTNIEVQQDLAARGLDNQLAFEKAALAKAEVAKEQEKLKEIKREKELAFLKLLAQYAESGNADQAVTKAFIQMGIAQAISGSFIEGTENVERDLKGNKVHSGRDGYVIAVDGQERILDPEQSSKIPLSMSNDELVKAALVYNSGYLPKIMLSQDTQSSTGVNMVNSIMLQQFASMTEEIKDLKRIIKEKPTAEIRMDNLGNVINKKISKGLIIERKNKPGQSPLNYI